MSSYMTDVSRYLQFLQNAGWSDLIDERWKEQVKKDLRDEFPEMTEDQWREIATVLFV